MINEVFQIDGRRQDLRELAQLRSGELTVETVGYHFG